MPTGIELDTLEIGSAGTLVGASLETAGQYMQSELLDLFARGFASDMGIFLFTVAAITAWIITAVGGNYKYFLWFLIGPPLFFFLITARVESVGTHWHFGELDRNQESKEEVMRGIIPPVQDQGIETASGRVVEVSWFFARWNQLSSSIVQNFIAVINSANTYRGVEFIVDVDRYMGVLTADVVDSRLIKFFHTIAYQKCKGQWLLRQGLYDRSITEERRLLLAQKLGDTVHTGINGEPEYRGGQNVVVLNATKYKDIIEDLRQRLLEPGGQPGNYTIRDRYQELMADPPVILTAEKLHYGAFNCSELWKVTVALFRDHAEQQLPHIIEAGADEDLTYEERLEKLIEKFFFQHNQDGSLSTITEDYFLAYNFLINEMAGRMILNEFKDVQPNIIARDLDEHALEDDPANHEESRETARLIRTLSGGVEFKAKGDYLTSMLSIPYIQGLALYFLALTFPFFAMLVLIPGRAGGFMVWMGLWFWIKSWDFGLAVVLMLADMLYVILPHGPPVTEADIQDPGLAFKKLLEVDPVYSVYLYYQLVATSLAAVPFLTGVLVQRGGGEIMRAIDQGFKNFGGRVGHSMGQMQRSILAGDEAARSRYSATAQLKGQAAKIMQENKGLQNQLLKGAAFSAGASGAGALSGLSGDTAKVFLDAGAKRHGNTASAIFKSAMEQASWASTNSFQMTKGASIATGLGMFSRHFGQDWNRVAAATMGAWKESVHPQINGTFDAHIWKTGIGLVSGSSKGGMKFDSGNKVEDILRAAPDALSGAFLASFLVNDDPTKKTDKTLIRETSYKGPGSPGAPDRPGYFGSIAYDASGAGMKAIPYDRLLPSNQTYGTTVQTRFEIGFARGKGKINTAEMEIVKEGARLNAETLHWTPVQRAIHDAHIEHYSGWNSSFASEGNSEAGLMAWSPSVWQKTQVEMQEAGVAYENYEQVSGEHAAYNVPTRLAHTVALASTAFMTNQAEATARKLGVDTANLDSAMAVYHEYYRNGSGFREDRLRDPIDEELMQLAREKLAQYQREEDGNGS